MARELSRGGQFYRTHRDVERARKAVERARWASGLVGLKATNPDYEGTLREFRVLARQRGWAMPNHSAKHRPSRKLDEAQRRFVEEAIGAQHTDASYQRLYYPPLKQRRRGQG
jgi:hypothetical protein